MTILLLASSIPDRSVLTTDTTDMYMAHTSTLPFMYNRLWGQARTDAPTFACTSD